MIPKSGYRFSEKRSCSTNKLERDNDSKNRRLALSRPQPRIRGAIDEFQRRAVGVAEVGARAVDDAATAILLEEDFDTARAQAVHGGSIFVRVEDEGMVDAVRHLERTLVDRSRPLDEQQAHAAGVEKRDLPAWLR